MRPVLALGALLLTSAPAAAACHQYSVWRYNFPQPKCGVQVASRGAVLPPPAPMRIYFGPPSIQSPPEQWNEDAARAFAIQKLREQLEHK